jgi:hypothetical protein
MLINTIYTWLSTIIYNSWSTSKNLICFFTKIISLKAKIKLLKSFFCFDRLLLLTTYRWPFVIVLLLLLLDVVFIVGEFRLCEQWWLRFVLNTSDNCFWWAMSTNMAKMIKTTFNKTGQKTTSSFVCLYCLNKKKTGSQTMYVNSHRAMGIE